MELVINELETVMIKERLEQLRKKRKENRQVKKWTLENFNIERECNEAIERFETLLRQREEALKKDGV